MTASATQKALALVVDLGEAAARAHTDATLAPAAAGALAKHLAVAWLEIARSDGARADARYARSLNHARPAQDSASTWN